MPKKTGRMSLVAVRVDKRQKEWILKHGSGVLRVLVNKAMTEEKEQEPKKIDPLK